MSINWFTWLYAVSTNNLLDSALGYYIFPILSVFLGIIFLKEKYNRNKIISVILVILALIYFLVKLGDVPWIGITVALTFSLYGLIRKKVKVSSEIGLLIETLLLTPIAIVLLFSGKCLDTIEIGMLIAVAASPIPIKIPRSKVNQNPVFGP